MASSKTNIKFYSIKDEIRVLGVDDAPFSLLEDDKTYIIGTVFRGGSWIDGVMRSEVEVDGIDSTDKLIEMVNKSRFKDLRVILLDGLGFGGFNLVDIKRLHEETALGVIVVVRKMPDFKAIDEVVSGLRHEKYYRRCMLHAGKPFKVVTRENKHIYIQYHGLSLEDARSIVKLTSTRSLIPEPIRVAHLIASGFVLGESKGNA
ncbi:MAG: hypothetical protein B6U97_03085 [Candidatus Altiarchaeales archaeon ex4484_96]|nr:MAG: hypothetical protein B6U97_03085 [Candidatus Altiarchaeales archaeon ex4484_96]